MKRRLIASFIIAVLIALTPLIVNIIESRISPPEAVPLSGLAVSSVKPTVTEGTAGVTYVGCGESHQGADYLVVCPLKAYVQSAGTEIIVNATVRFRHAQPCPYSDWKILTEKINGAELVSESEVKLINAYTAVKHYVFKVLSNGSVDVVFKYGTGCPYGTEERVHIEFFIVKSAPPAQVQASPTTTSAPSVQEVTLKGALESVDLDNKLVVVNSTKVLIKGSWVCNENEVKWRDLLMQLSELPKGTRVTIKAVNEEGELRAVEIIFGNVKCVKG